MHPLTLFLDVLSVCAGLALGGLCIAGAVGAIVCALGAVRRTQSGGSN